MVTCIIHKKWKNSYKQKNINTLLMMLKNFNF